MSSETVLNLCLHKSALQILHLAHINTYRKIALRHLIKIFFMQAESGSAVELGSKSSSLETNSPARGKGWGRLFSKRRSSPPKTVSGIPSGTPSAWKTAMPPGMSTSLSVFHGKGNMVGLPSMVHKVPSKSRVGSSQSLCYPFRFRKLSTILSDCHSKQSKWKYCQWRHEASRQALLCVCADCRDSSVPRKIWCRVSQSPGA